MKNKEINKNGNNKKKTKKTILKIGACVLASVLIVGVLMFANSLVGNPISQAIAKNTAEKHLEKIYGDTDYELGEITYSFKDGYYHAHISSPSSNDTRFSLMINSFGELKYDNYDSYVESGFNTAQRIDSEYRKAAETVFGSSKFPYNENIGFGELIFIAEEDKNAADVQDYALVTNELTPDAYYDANELGKKAGKLTVYIEDDNVSAEKMAEILLGIRKCFDESGLSFYAIDCVLEPVDNFSTDNRVEVMEFRYADIYGEGLVERVEEAAQAAKDYYYAWDSEKFEEQP